MGSNPDLGLGIEPWEGPGHCRATVHVSLGNPFLNSPWAGKEGGSWGRGCYTVGAAPVSVLLSLGHTTAARRGEGFGYRDLLDCRTKDSSSTRMNFAAQLFYSSYLSERLERLYSPRLALKDSEENDPFWQRWEITTCSPLDPPDFSPNQLSSLTQLRPVETDLPSTQSLEISNSVPLSSVPPPHPLSSQPTLTNTPSNLPSLSLPTPPDLNHKGKSTQTTTCLPNPCLAAAIPKSRTYELPSNKPPAPSRPSAETASSSTIFQSSSLTPAPYRGEQHLTFQALVDLLLRLVLYLILLFVPR